MRGGNPPIPRVAERFELYVAGVELANSFGELTDPVEQRRRFEADMTEKQRIYGERYPIDEDFLVALAMMPEASGCRARPRPPRDAGDRRRAHRRRDLDSHAGRGMTALSTARTLRNAADLVDAGLASPDRLPDLERVAARYAVAISPLMAELVDNDNLHDPIARQFVPDAAELQSIKAEHADPIGDKAHEVVPGLIHRYPDRVLLKLPNICARLLPLLLLPRNGRSGQRTHLSDAEIDAALRTSPPVPTSGRSSSAAVIRSC